MQCCYCSIQARLRSSNKTILIPSSLNRFIHLLVCLRTTFFTTMGSNIIPTPPATEALRRCQEYEQSPRPPRLEMHRVFDTTILYEQLDALDSMEESFPIISWPNCTSRDDQAMHPIRKTSYSKLKRRSKHGMVRSKSHFGLSRLAHCG